MRCPPDTGSGHSPAWKKLLLTGTLLASCTCSASPELPFSAPQDSWTEGASAHLPVPWRPGGLLATSWFRGREAQAAAMIVSPEGLPGPAHTGREALGAQGSLLIANVTAGGSGSYTVVLETSRGRRSATKEIRVSNTPRQVPLRTYPQATKGIIYSDLNFSVILEWVVTMDPEPELTWTFNGRIYGTGEKLFIRRLSREQLGIYVCTGQNSQTLLSSEPVTISLPPEPQVDVTPTAAEPFQPDPILPLSRGSAIALIAAATVGGVTLLGIAGFYCIKHLSTD
ncbi:immunoglobulin superfamily member 23 [Sciurus carolinensis]|uniref:immunoglobulin superfamily member 23 n=1 Tax=Sciurus carolinensis TaxID=30640 RepID=UPI001FB4A789|nr:immunoglobulin superfamily member 23 [Sciurus carolinensis]